MQNNGNCNDPKQELITIFNYECDNSSKTIIITKKDIKLLDPN